MRGDPRAPLYADRADIWTPERWEHLRQRLHRAGLLQKKGHAPGALKVPKPERRKGPSTESSYDLALGDGRFPKFEGEAMCHYRRQVGRRHARRRMRRATRQAQRRAAR